MRVQPHTPVQPDARVQIEHTHAPLLHWVWRNAARVLRRARIQPRPKRNVVILSRYRMGTHHLLGILCSNGFIDRGEELLRSRRDLNLISPDLDGDAEMYRRVKEYARKNHVGPTGYVVHYDQMMRLLGTCEPDTWRAALRDLFGEADYIHMTRDVVDAVVSLTFAVHQDSWMSWWKPKTDTVPEYDYDVLLRWYEEYTHNWVWDAELLRSLSALEVKYEELVRDSRSTLMAVEQLIGIPLLVKKQYAYLKQEEPRKLEHAARFREELKKAGN